MHTSFSAFLMLIAETALMLSLHLFVDPHEFGEGGVAEVVLKCIFLLILEFYFTAIDFEDRVRADTVLFLQPEQSLIE